MNSANVIDNDMTCYFDVDDTLIYWNVPEGLEHRDAIEFNSFGTTVRLVPHLKHIEQLKQHRARGHFIVVWSAGGAAWGKEAVKALGLEEYVDLIIAKPRWYYDDLPSQEFLPEANRRFIKE